MTDTFTLVLTALTLGQVILVQSILITKNVEQPLYQPLLGFFVAISLLLSQPLVAAFLPEAEVFSVLVMLPALLVLAPLLWMYVQNMTASQPIESSRSTLSKHLALPFVALVVSTLTALLPKETLTALLSTEDAKLSVFVGVLMIFAFLLVLSWPLQSAYYVYRIVKRVTSYHQKLNDLFANNETRKMNWVLVVSGLLISIWLVALLAVLADNILHIKIINAAGATLMALVWVWCLSYFAILQKPGFDGEDPESILPVLTEEQDEKKYQRSALSSEHAQRIAQKLENLMQSEQVYLDPNVSLSKLADLTGVSANYISQTLNETMQRSFFDYINGWRIQYAKPILLDSDKSILEIAYEAGFNARSSFYKAFKQYTEQTPSEFRKENKRN